ncbi:MAG TPA: DNA repair protein RecN [Candidatus Polarisedimenticolia bacterium]|nr:DNA repair protein RecN [Candidatus Polarisedimenticolia bacterium]
MIRCLHIANLAIIREATLDLGPGLNLLTGETGAGKSIVVDALALVLGGRGGAELIRSGAERASVEAVLDASGNRAAAAFLDERGYATEGGGTVVARREIPALGKGRAFLGGVLAPLQDLKTLGSLLVDLHGQHQHQTLLNPANHRGLLDRQAGLSDDLAAMAAAARDLQAAAARLASMREGAQRIAQRIDMLRFQIEEIDRAAIRPGEGALLRGERQLLRNAETILRHGRVAYEALYDGESAALARLSETIREMRDLLRFDPSLGADLARAESARADLQEVAVALRDYPARLSFEPHRLEAIEERLVMLDVLLRKYAPGGDEEALLRFRQEAGEELSELTGGAETVSDLETRVTTLRLQASRLAAALARRRRAAASDLETLVERELGDLAMERTRFAVEFRTLPSSGSGVWFEGEEVAVDGAGVDVVEFFLSANQGEALRPLAAIASGGELSRLMLALEVVLRRDIEARTLVFDEVDAGIGGAVAEAVGRKLKSLARAHQVVSVTHLPQIASQADRHVLVQKRPARGRTEVSLEVLDETGRVRELARMMAGERVTPSALRHAAELLARGVPR